MKPKLKLVILFVIVVLFLGGCTGDKGLIPIKGPVNRIVSLAPNLTEIIFALKADPKLIGVTTQCDFPEDAKLRQKVGSFGSPDLERILFLKPDLVIYTDVQDLSVIARLRDLKIPVRRYQVKNLTELYGVIANLGEITEKRGHSLQLVKSLQRRVARVKKRAKPFPKIRVLFQISERPFRAVGGQGLLNELIVAAGGQNVLMGLRQNYPKVEDELILQTNPQLVIQPMKGSYFFNQQKFKSLSAVTNNNVIEFSDPDIVLRPGPRLADGLEAIFLLFQNYRDKQKAETLPQ